ncbi:hypothetical protein [Nocardioides sp. B-3]|uniref:hypothetical protein n=1 Tax=Nocardioides sp. B-3 TaxID=2895565 RepID=UPI00215315A6|nr:hypothetical protein [Nocardioides sp. B-3]UUZ58486.1 hypothetical protein LP418_20250 [Nocardioides sp. B-3]
MRESGGAEVVGQRRVETAVVAHDQRGHQLPGVLAPGLDGRADRRAHRRGRPPPDVRPGLHSGRAAHGQHPEHRRAAAVVGGEPPGDADRRAEAHVEPALVRQQHHRRPQGVRRTATRHLRERAPHHHEVAEPARHHSGVARHRHACRHHGPVSDRVGHRSGAERRDPEGRHPDHGEGGQRARQRRPGP